MRFCLLALIVMLVLGINTDKVHASISGITTTAGDGFERITDNQQVTGTATINGETIILEGSSSVLESLTAGSVIVRGSQIKLDDDVSGSNNAAAPINYGAKADTGTTMAFRDNSQILFAPLTGRKNILISELSDSSVVEAENTGEAFVYTQDSAILSNCTFRGVNVWEIYGAPSIAFNITVANTNYGYLNWEAGRLDFIGFAVQNPAIADAWLGNGNGGNNEVHHWNNVQFDNTNIDFQNANGLYYEGWTASWTFTDRSTELPVEDVLVIYRDDSGGIGGSLTELDRYTTDANGHLFGTYDSQMRTTGAAEERGALFIRTIQSDQSGSDYSAGGGNTYELDNVSVNLEVRSYLHEAPSGFLNGDSYSISEQIGEIQANGNVATYVDFLLVPDANITNTDNAAVLAYSALNNLDMLYDRAKAEWRDNDDFPLLTASSSSLVLPNTWNLDIISDATLAYEADNGSRLIRIKATTLRNGNTFDAISTINGVISLINGATLSGINYIDESGSSSSIIVSGLTSSNVLVYNKTDDSTIDYSTSQTGTYNYSIAPTSDNNYSVRVRRAGYTEAELDFDPSGGGAFTLSGNLSQRLSLSGAALYAATGNDANVTFDWANKLILLQGAVTYTAQELFDIAQRAQITENGLKLDAIMDFDGDSNILLLDDWQLMNGDSLTPTVQAFVATDDSRDIIETNGSVQVREVANANAFKQDQIITLSNQLATMLEKIQGSSYDDTNGVYLNANGALLKITGDSFDNGSHGLSDIIDTMHQQGILNTNTIKDIIH